MFARSAVAVAIVVAVAVAAAAYFAIVKQGDHSSQAINSAPASSSLTIITLSGDSLVAGATYRITPLFPNSTAITIADGSTGDTNAADGIIGITNLGNGNYSVTQVGMPAVYPLDSTPRFVQITGKPVAIDFSSSQAGPGQQVTPQPKSVTYTAKFECGTINGSEGPLRPGRYDTDISMLNKQDFPIKVLWSASVIHGSSTNTVVQNLDPREATSIVCKDLTSVLGISGKFTEGFVYIETPLDAQVLGQLSINGAEVVGSQQNNTDLLDVQVFYTANALDVLPHEVYMDKISFAIVNDTTGKIPHSFLNKELDITVPSNVSTVSDPEVQVKQAIADQYHLSASQVDSLQIRIDGVGAAVSATIDDHAISLARIPPQPTG